MAAPHQGLSNELSIRPQTTLDTVQEILEGLAARHRAGEVLTAVKHLPAREAEFRPMPDWVRPELARRTARKESRSCIRIRRRQPSWYARARTSSW